MKKFITGALAALLAVMLTACGASQGSGESAGSSAASASGTVYKVGIVQYVDDASLNQIEKAIEEELTKKGTELGVTFDFADYTYNGQADATTLNQIATELVADEVDVIIPIATPTAMIMQAATEENQIPVVFSAVSDPVGAGLVASMDKPGSNITGTSDMLDTEAVLNLMLAANPSLTKVGLLYNKGEDASAAPIAAAKEFLGSKGIEVVEKTGTTNDEISNAADALVAAQVEAVFTPTDNTVMTAELAIYEKFVEAGIPHYCGADSFALNGAFLGYGVNYEELGTATADIAADILAGGKSPADYAVVTLDNGIATVNTETAAAIGMDYSSFSDLCEQVIEITTAENFE